MHCNEVMRELEALGTAQNRKVYARHGARGAMFGVSYANLGILRKRIKVDHDLAVQLWKTGNSDARVLATMIADPAQLDASVAEAWVNDLDNHGLAGALAGLVARSPAAREKMEKWTRSSGEWIGCTGWNILAHLAMNDETLPDAQLESYLKIIERDIHAAKNRVRYAMNSALIAIGIRNRSLKTKALVAAARIGKVEVDHGETGCKTPDATAYIHKASKRKHVC